MRQTSWLFLEQQKIVRFLSFLKKGTGLNLKFRSSEGQSYEPGDYSLLHSEEFEKKRLVVVYDFTNNWDIEWGGHDIYTSPNKDPLICNRDSGTLMLTLLDGRLRLFHLVFILHYGTLFNF